MKKISANQQQIYNISFKSSKDVKNSTNDEQQHHDVKEDSLDVMANSPQTVSAMAQVHKDVSGKDSKLDPDSPDFDISVFRKDLESRRINDFSVNDDDYDYNFESSKILTDEEFENISNSLTNPIVKKVFDKTKNFSQENVSEDFAYTITEMDRNLAVIEDDYVKGYVHNKLEGLATLDGEDSNVDFYIGLKKANNIVDAYHQLKGNMSPIKTYDLGFKDFIIEDSKPVEYLKARSLNYGKDKGKDPLMELLKSEKDVSDIPLVEDFRNTVRFSSFDKIADEPEISDYLYENYYVKPLNVDDKDKELLLKIKNDLGTKVVIPTHTDNINKSLNFIYDELNDWKVASKGKIKCPDLLFISMADEEFLGNTGGYFSRSQIYLKHGEESYLQDVFRHELIHKYNNNGPFLTRIAKDKETADMINSIMPAKIVKDENGYDKKVVDFPNCKYREEFLKAGIDYDHIPYAYTNSKEFIAVAGEGDTSQYSPEFKNVLVKMGLPEFVFDLPCKNPKIINNVNNVKRYMENLNKPLQYDEYVNHKKRGEEFANYLFDLIFNPDFNDPDEDYDNECSDDDDDFDLDNSDEKDDVKTDELLNMLHESMNRVYKTRKNIDASTKADTEQEQ